jgi:NAD(P)H-flavin reductase
MTQTTQTEDNLIFEEDLEELSEDYELEVAEAVQELKDELSIQSELLEQLVQVNQERLEQDKAFQDKLIIILDKLANK